MVFRLGLMVAMIMHASAVPDAPRDSLDHIPEHMRRPKYVQFRPASDVEIARWQRMSVDGRRYFVSGPPLFDGNDVLSTAASGEGLIELTLEARAAERMVRFPVDRFGIVVNKQLLAVAMVSTVADGSIVRLGGLSAVEVDRLEAVLAIAPSDSNLPRVLVVPQRSTVSPGERIRVDVYLANARALSMYQVGLDVVGGRKGRILWEEARVDRERPDFVFTGRTSVSSAQQESGLICGLLSQGTVDVEKQAYLGTFFVRSSPDALGTFTLRARGDGHTQILGEGQAPIDARLGANAILVGVDANPGFAK